MTHRTLNPRYWIVGLVLMVVSEAATLARIEPFWSWNTPIAWTGFILFADGLVGQVRGDSWLRSNPREFVFLAVVSIPLWLVFEGYNRFIHNWYYVGLTDHRLLRYVGYAWSFGTIWPAIFEGAELVGMWRGSTGGARTHRPMTEANADRTATDRRIIVRQPVGVWSWVSIAAGAALLAWPVIRPSPYLAAPVWLGFVFLLDPINEYLRDESLFADVRARRYDRLINLVSSGFLCGILWEFWNYWARAKWHYTVPIMEKLKIFEMPLPGYLGFPAFALECFTMYVFLRHVCFRLAPDLMATERPRTIAL